MSLSFDDFRQMESLLDRKLGPVLGEITALRNDIKEIYDTLLLLGKDSVKIDESFNKKSSKQQILQLHALIVSLAKKENIELPS